MFKKLEFITPTLLQILGLLLENPMQEYHQREVVRKANVSLGSANKILKFLVDNRFVVVQKRGKMMFYKLNSGEPSVRQFKIFLNVFILRDFVERIKEQTRRVVLFGSAAQGTDVRESDLDLLFLCVDKSTVRKEILKFNNPKENSRRIAPILVNANEFVKLKSQDEPLYENIRKGIVLWQAE